jgi:hypothetical protein
MLHKLCIHNSCYIINPRNMICFRYALVNTLHNCYNQDYYYYYYYHYLLYEGYLYIYS